MNLQEYVKAHRKNKKDNLIPRIKCNDGFEMSVQGSSGHYSSPREYGDEFYEMEIGFPTQEEALIIQYAENKDDLTNTVYGWVPVHVIQKVIDKHGGIDLSKYKL